MATVLGHPVRETDITPAILMSYKALFVAGKSYPGLKADPDGQTSGLVFENLSDQDVNKLIDFEGEKFSLIDVSVVCEKGQVLSTKVFSPNQSVILSEDQWGFSEWSTLHKQKFLSGVTRGKVFPDL